MLRYTRLCALLALAATAGCMTGDDASQVLELSSAQCASARAWVTNTAYATGAIVTFQGGTYQCRQPHTSLSSWTPTAAPALWQVGSCNGGTSDAGGNVTIDASAPVSSTCNRNAWNFMGNNEGACRGHIGEPCGWTSTNQQQGYTCQNVSWGVACAPGGVVCPGGSTDAGIRDAGTVVDAGRDAGSVDAGRDAGSVDAGRDAGTPIVWQRANLTNFTSYPDPDSEECREYNGCTWAGMFAAVNGTMPLSWVMSHNIAAVHSRDFSRYRLKTLRLRQNNRTIDVTVYDMCADSDCSGCCTENASQNGLNFLIDIESFTMERFGSGDGIVEWTCIDC